MEKTPQYSVADCHNSDQSPGTGGKGANGPHGSIWEPILERKVEFRDGQAESPATYALCYKCHERSSILADQSFPTHNLHVREKNISCESCHDPHGSSISPHLINFNKEYVSPNSKGMLSYEERGRFAGQCNLSCHGKDHDNTVYPALIIPGPLPGAKK